MAEYLSFEEVAAELKCSKNKVRQLVIEDRILSATRFTPNGVIVESSGPDAMHPYDLSFCDHLDDEGMITSDFYKDQSTGETVLTQTLPVGNLRIERTNLKAFRALNPRFESLADTGLSESEAKPWLLPDPKDPTPEQPWYTPARFFARQLVREDTTLLTKRPKLADKVSKSLAGAGVFKRGGKSPPAADTVLKALVNVPLG